MILIAGPCMAESYELMKEVALYLKSIADQHGLEYYFKASYDKANRTSLSSPRGPGLEQGMEWMAELKREIQGLKVLTDVHETTQVAKVAEVCDVIQIPAMLCRQTDLVVEAGETGLPLNIKKGMFLSPEAMAHIVGKTRNPSLVACTERGTSFGYGDMVVDMRSLKVLSKNPGPVIYDVSHSVQRPPANGGKSGGDVSVAPMLARAAAATGYIDGIFMEVHPTPETALSDGQTSVNLEQAAIIIYQTVEILKIKETVVKDDKKFNRG